MCVYLRTKFHVSSIIPTSFREGVILPNTAKQTHKNPTQIRAKRTLGCCKINNLFTSQINLSNVFRSKDHLPYDHVRCVVYKFQCGRCNSSYYSETDR